MIKEFKTTTNEQINIEDMKRAYDSFVNNKKAGIYDIILPYNQVANTYLCLYKQQEQIENQSKEIEILQDCLKIEKERRKKGNDIINELEKYIEFYVSGNPIYDEKTTQLIWNKLKSLKVGITNETDN